MRAAVTLVLLVSSNTIICKVINQDCRPGNYACQSEGAIEISTNPLNLTTTEQEETKDRNYENRDMKEKGNMFTKVLPYMVIPFMISSAMTPMVLTSLKFMLLQAIFVGKMAVILLLINAFWRFNNQGGVYSHNVNLKHDEKELAMAHYGFNGDEEYGAYVHR